MLRELHESLEIKLNKIYGHWWCWENCEINLDINGVEIETNVGSNCELYVLLKVTHKIYHTEQSTLIFVKKKK